jgi:tripeptidyl-peptidase-2
MTDQILREDKFPTKGILPKEETLAQSFISKHPEYDGRGVVVAIFDTGVDPGAPGLSVTTDGKPKIIDIVDCSGSGDVDTSTVVEAVDGVIKGLSGRKLRIGKWDNPSGKYHIGIKRAFEIQPRGLTPRIKKERKEKFDIKQRETVNVLQREINDATKKNSPSKKDLEARLEVLSGLSFEDPGPIYDIVVFQDNNGIWRAVVDTTEEGDLSKIKPLADYRLEHQYSTFSIQDMLNFSVNIYDEGNVCCICTDAGAHGTHVAGIVAANFPDQPELNGIAPGAQIMAVKIGDSRLGSMETGTSMVRALIAAKRANVDLINMSYGEPITRANIGRFIELTAEIVKKHNIIFVASAGNNGPCLSTVSAPGGTSAHLIGVGAMVSPQMMSVEYSLREELPETFFTWSSRGPTDDGSLGVCISAPGGAIAPVPNWTLKKNQQMNGTSMSSPNGCGNIALILSGLKALHIPYTPHSIKRAIENTAAFKKSFDHFTQGYGCIQSLPAFDYCRKFHSEVDLRIELSVSEKRGIYLRNVSDLAVIKEYTVNIEPCFHETYANTEKIKFEKRLILTSTVPWIKSPEYLLLPNEQRQFKITVDPTELAEGPHYGEIQCFDSEHPDAGPIARLPCTIIKPYIFQPKEYTKTYEKLTFTPGLIRRFFFSVPPGATWAKTTITATGVIPKRLYVYQRNILTPQLSLKTMSDEQYIWIEGEDVKSDRFHVSEGQTLEVSLSQYWSSLGTTGTLTFDIEFHAITMEIQGTTTHLSSSEYVVAKLGFPLRNEKILPKATLSVVKKRLTPVSSVINALHPVRDCLPDGRQIYSCINTYNFSVPESSTVLTRVVGFDQLLYDSPHECQFWMIYDENKQLLFSGDFIPEAVSLSKKGKYTARVQFRHDNIEYLKQLKGFHLLLERHLPKDKQLSLPLYPTVQDALVNGTKFSSKAKTSSQGQTEIVVIGPPAESKLPKDIEAGDVLSGYILLRNLDEGESTDTSVPKKGLLKPVGGFWIDHFITPSNGGSTRKSQNTGFAFEDNKSIQENYELSLQHHIADYVTNLVSKKKLDHAKAILEENLKKYPEFLPLLKANVTYHSKEAETSKNYGAVAHAADMLISKIDENELAKFFGLKHEEEGNVVKTFEKSKGMLTGAYQSKAEALLDLYLLTHNNDDKEAFLKVVNDLNKWSKNNVDIPLKLQVYQEKLKGNLGAALKLLKKKAESGNDKETTLLMIEIFNELGWYHWSQNKSQLDIIQFPQDFALF